MTDTPSRQSAALWMDAWIDIGIGVVILAVFPRWLEWASSRLLHTPFTEFTDINNAVVPYTRVPEFWADLGPVLFGLMMIVSGLLLFTRTRGAVIFALGLTAISTVYNGVYLLLSFTTYGLAMASLIAVVLGGYLLMHQWQILSRWNAPGGFAVSAGSDV